MKLQDELYKKARLSKSEEDWIIAKQHRNVVNSMCKIAKREHIKAKIIKNSDNPSKFWKELNKMWGSKKSDSDNMITPYEEETSNNIEGREVANSLYKYFSPIGDNYNNK